MAPPDPAAATVHPRGTPQEVTATLRAWLDGPPEQRLVVETSGSTGRPKRVVLDRAAVLASAEATRDRLGAAGPWVLRVPPTYVAGIQVIVRSLVAGREPYLDPDAWPEENGPWFVSMVATQLRRSLESPGEVAALARAHTVLLGGGPIGPGLPERATELGIRTVATYGAAETAGGCVYDGIPLAGVELALDDGRILVGGPTLARGYLDDPEATEAAFGDGLFRTSDLGRLDDGRLTVLGRVDDVIVSGGLNVPGPAVADRLRAHPAVADAEVLGVEDPEWGSRVVAFVEGELGLADARDWIGEVHLRTWAPRQLVRLDHLPRTGNGKPDRAALRAAAAGEWS